MFVNVVLFCFCSVFIRFVLVCIQLLFVVYYVFYYVFYVSNKFLLRFQYIVQVRRRFFRVFFSSFIRFTLGVLLSLYWACIQFLICFSRCLIGSLSCCQSVLQVERCLALLMFFMLLLCVYSVFIRFVFIIFLIKKKTTNRYCSLDVEICPTPLKTKTQTKQLMSIGV